MEIKKTYYILRDGIYIWLSQNENPLITDRILEERTILLADDGKTLIKEGNDVSSCVWVRDNNTSVYTEELLPAEEEKDL